MPLAERLGVLLARAVHQPRGVRRYRDGDGGKRKSRRSGAAEYQLPVDEMRLPVVPDDDLARLAILLHLEVGAVDRDAVHIPCGELHVLAFRSKCCRHIYYSIFINIMEEQSLGEYPFMSCNKI